MKIIQLNTPEGFAQCDFILFISGMISILKSWHSVEISTLLLHMPLNTEYTIQGNDNSNTKISYDSNNANQLTISLHTEDNTSRQIVEVIREYLPNYNRLAFEELREICNDF